VHDRNSMSSRLYLNSYEPFMLYIVTIATLY
jgi:hypothetical protein